ncbi:MAG: hypothetical protein CO139_03790 [Candidatus Moranbacteria bacterium CG_4_9_14_3_um_filter_36_9]|nr:MAG: hypothetical protein CO139_03790 [Candidatus Moranbacteria bacterium CG_4_9_14_3_um_filter_36_9]
MNHIGIDGSRYFLKQRTGIEEYSYQITKGLRNKLNSQQVVLYVRKNQEIDFSLPENWKIKVISWPRFWTQIGLSWELLFHPVDVLFIPAHVVPIIRAKNTVVTIHGLEYEFCPEAYSFWERFYMRFSIKNSCRWAKTIIAVSENTKKDLMKLYGVAENKIKVVYEGHDNKLATHNSQLETQKKYDFKYLLFVGRLEERKNISGIISAFEILKEKYQIPHKLVLAGKPGYGYEKIESQSRVIMTNLKSKEEIIFTGFIGGEEKENLIKNAEVFLFPTFYEGFGLPILEAQNLGVPVVASNNSSIPEIVCSGLTATDEKSAVLVDPNDIGAIAEAVHQLISDKNIRDDIIKKGLENVKRFSWEKCAEEIAEVLRSES